MKKPKFYVVWKGRTTGIFDNWEDCKAQVNNFPKPKFKSFPTKSMAEEAFAKSPSDFMQKKETTIWVSDTKKALIGSPILESISVDGAWNTETGDAEYQGVETATKNRIFHAGPFSDGTNNIVEFLAIVHALAHCKKNNILLPIYSDSKIAMSWVRKKEAKKKLEQNAKNKKLFELLERAEKWLKENEYPNQILKWETQVWGENPADFGRK
ncbi:MAG: viroplasmin family protein [Bacteroidia bacterium]